MCLTGTLYADSNTHRLRTDATEATSMNKDVCTVYGLSQTL